MTFPSDRLLAVELIKEAHNGGARLKLAVKELGLSLRSFQRWKSEGSLTYDKRPFATRAKPSFKLY